MSAYWIKFKERPAGCVEAASPELEIGEYGEL